MGLFLIIAAMAVRLALFGLGEGYIYDINCFKAWSIMLFEDGFANFYLSDAFTDYPPGYMYVLYVIGWLRQSLGLAYESPAFTVLIKLPAVLCDTASVAFLYHLAKQYRSKRIAVLLALAYALNPAVLINSSVWGQVDAVYTLLLLVSIYLLTAVSENRRMFSYAAYAVALLIKPQALMFAPVYAYAAYDRLSRERFAKPAVISFIQDCAIGLGLIILAILPFTRGLDFGPVVRQYANTIGSYPYASVNAYNVHSLFGGNWMPVSDRLLFMSHGAWGALAIVCAVGLCLYVLHKTKYPGKYFFAAAFINAMTFVFSTRMHERYVFPAVVFLTAAYIMRPTKSVALLVTGFSATLFINCADILRALVPVPDAPDITAQVTAVSLINVGLALFMICTAVRGAVDTQRKPLSLPAMPKNWETIAVCGITLTYAAVAFANLGDMSAPTKAWTAATGEVVADLGFETPVTDMIFKNGVTEDRQMTLAFSADGQTWDDERPIGSGGVFAWHEHVLEVVTRYVKITPVSNDLTLLEMGFRSNGRLLAITADADGGALFDEQHLIPDYPGYRNSTYFDEIYHARTAYEYLHGLTPYENTHPPLGKDIIALGIALFGMNPFGARVMGAVFGILMLPLIYLFAKRVCAGQAWAVFAAAILAVDFMHFSQTRIATTDSFVTFFILAAYYCMYCYCSTGCGVPLRRLLTPLALSGLCMGLAIAVKWQGAYAAIGLAVLFFADLAGRWRGNRDAPAFGTRTLAVLAACVVFFVVVPVAVYLLSYIPYMRAPGMDGLRSVFQNQLSMFAYHTQLSDRHPFESVWWQWPLDIRPVFLHLSSLPGGLRSAISVMGNPVVWYAGLVAMLYIMCNRPDRTDAFLLIAFAAQIVPWIPVSRCTFLYHYFPCVGFMILLLARALAKKSRRVTAMVIALAAGVLFVVYYPVISGAPSDPAFVHKYLEWLPTWVII